MNFVNEGKLDEDRARKQAEWERVRKPDDPLGYYLILIISTKILNTS